MKATVVIGILVLVVWAFEGVNSQANVTAGLVNGYRAYTWASGLSSPRQMVAFSNGDVIVVENGAAQITLLWDSTGTNGYANNKVVWGSAPALQSNIQYHNGYVYAANATHIFRWPFSPGDRTPPSSATVVVANMPQGDHNNRPHDFDSAGRLYVAIGSGSNIDPDASRSKIIRFDSSLLQNLPVDYSQATIFASGTRNEAGLRFNRYGQLWGVENGMDDVMRSDLGGDIHNNNPGEEINLFPDPNGGGSIPIGSFYGYPYCFSEYMINVSKSGGRGSQWTHQDFLNTAYNDSWCNSSNVVKPKFQMPPHNAPLDIVFYETNNPNLAGVWPSDAIDSAFVALHGSWDRNPPSGYRVLQIKFDANHNPVSSVPFFYIPTEGSDGSQSGNGWNYRPAGVQFAKCGSVKRDCLLVASDTTNDITAIVYATSLSPTPSITPSPGSDPSQTSSPNSNPSPSPSSFSGDGGQSNGDGGSGSVCSGILMEWIKRIY